MKRKYYLMAVFGASLALTLIAYGSILHGSFMYDDPVDLGRGVGRSVWSLLTSSEGYAYYRPLTFLLWKGLFAVFHYHNLVLSHALSLLVHAANGLLVCLLFERMVGRRAAIVGAALFVLFPLSYQAVQWIDSFMHLLATCFVLVILLSYIRFRAGGPRRWLALSIAMCPLAFLTHEGTIVVSGLIVLWEAWSAWRERRRLSAWPLLYIALSVLWLGVWLAVPKDSGDTSLQLNALPVNLLYYLQGFVYPIAALVRPVEDALAVSTSAYAILAAVVLIVVSVLAVLYGRGRTLPVLLFALAWLLIASAPVIPLRSIVYVENGPRLLYLGSVGIALAWAGLMALPARRVGRVFAPVALVAVAAFSLVFIQQRNELYRFGSRAVYQLVDAVAAEPGLKQIAVVNFPGGYAQKRQYFPLGNTGVSMVPDYVGLDGVVAIHRGPLLRVRSVKYEPLLADSKYNYVLHGQSVREDELSAIYREADAVFVARPERPETRKVGTVRAAQAGELRSAASARWRSLQLDAARVERVNDNLILTLTWSTDAAPTTDLPPNTTVFVHLVDANQRIVAQADAYPLGGAFPFRAWQAGERVEDVRYFQFAEGGQAKPERLAIGLYNLATGERVPALGPDGSRLPDDTFWAAVPSME